MSSYPYIPGPARERGYNPVLYVMVLLPLVLGLGIAAFFAVAMVGNHGIAPDPGQIDAQPEAKLLYPGATNVVQKAGTAELPGGNGIMKALLGNLTQPDRAAVDTTGYTAGADGPTIDAWYKGYLLDHGWRPCGASGAGGIGGSIYMRGAREIFFTMELDGNAFARALGAAPSGSSGAQVTSVGAIYAISPDDQHVSGC